MKPAVKSHIPSPHKLDDSVAYGRLLPIQTRSGVQRGSDDPDEGDTDQKGTLIIALMSAAMRPVVELVWTLVACTDTFWTNPQYSVEVIDPDEGDTDQKGTLIIALMQKERRKKKLELGLDLLTVGYSIYKVLIVGGVA